MTRQDDKTGMIALADFAGMWRLERRIADALGPPGRFSGVARFTRDADGLHLTEEGRLDLGKASFKATRAYLWRADGDAIAVLFADGRAFHRFTPQGAADSAHWCDPDQYDVTYDFTRWPVWTSAWRVRGPRKDYVMQSTYRR